ncbi:MAG TPA: hypothetical protein VM600_05405 [Actinomycetota bacterium]|nr:hypothetical protein [Actinomycetota bacterium]
MPTGTFARRFQATVEPLTAMIYFVPEAAEEYAAVGIDPVAGYFMSRSAAMGRVSASVVASTFYNFSPTLVRNVVNWDEHDPAVVLTARHKAVRRSLERLISDESGAPPDVTRLVALLKQAVAGAPPEGRPLFAAHAALSWPDDDIVGVWHGANCLREFRGDCHIALLISHGMNAVDALMLNGAYAGTTTFLMNSRMWGDAAYEASREALRARGFFDADGALTDGGRKFRDMIEMETDRLSAAPFEALGSAACEELESLLVPLVRRLGDRKGAPGYLMKGFAAVHGDTRALA